MVKIQFSIGFVVSSVCLTILASNEDDDDLSVIMQNNMNNASTEDDDDLSVIMQNNMNKDFQDHETILRNPYIAGSSSSDQDNTSSTVSASPSYTASLLSSVPEIVVQKLDHEILNLNLTKIKWNQLSKPRFDQNRWNPFCQLVKMRFPNQYESSTCTSTRLLNNDYIILLRYCGNKAVNADFLKCNCDNGIFFIIFYNEKYSVCVVVNTKLGSIRGIIERSRSGKEFYAFYGIPYAQPPLDDLRFANPEPPLPWSGIRDGSVLPQPCPFSEYPDDEMTGDEDCLYLNLYVPKSGYDLKNSNLSLPVIVFIFGGAFQYCHALPSRYGPHYFMDKSVILITFHYRIGTLGFLSFCESSLPGNFGLKDFVAVLKWVQEHIENFNGDKKSVTVMGGSSGGVAACLALISPLAKGLFHRSICQSGFVDNFSHNEVQSKKAAYIVASNVGCLNNTLNNEDIVACLRKVKAKDLVRQQHEEFSGIKFEFSPVIEDEKVPEAFLVDDYSKFLPYDSKIPVLFGINSNEGGMLAIFYYYGIKGPSPIIENLASNYREILPKILSLQNLVPGSNKSNLVADFIKNRFFGDIDIRKNALGFAKMITVMQYLTMFKKFMELYKGPKYAYYYDHRNEPNFDLYYGNTLEKMGVIHGDELLSMFNWSESIPPKTEGIDFAISEKVLDLWMNFVKFGDPNGDVPDQDRNWQPVTSDKLHYFHIRDGAFTMTDQILKSDYNFLNELWSMME